MFIETKSQILNEVVEAQWCHLSSKAESHIADMFLYIDYRLVKYLIITLVEYLVEKSLKSQSVRRRPYNT